MHFWQWVSIPFGVDGEATRMRRLEGANFAIVMFDALSRAGLCLRYHFRHSI